MNVIDLFNTTADKVKQEQNGELSIASFNLKLKSACIWLLDYLSGSIEGLVPPEPYLTQKSKDYLAPLLTTVKGIVEDGTFNVPAQYFMFENMSVLGSYKDQECGEEIIRAGCDTPIELLDSAVYDQRCFTYIKSLKPSMRKPIAKIESSDLDSSILVFKFQPSDLGSIKLVFKRYPIYGEVKVKVDPVYNDEIPDPDTSIDCEFGEWARNLIVWHIVQSYAGSNRENALQEQNQVIAKSVRG